MDLNSFKNLSKEEQEKIYFQIKDKQREHSKLMIHRCERDIEINYELWKKMGKYLTQIYEGNHNSIIKYLDYLSFKMQCFSMHQDLGVNLDIELCKKTIGELEAIKEEKINNLKAAMPKRAIKSIKVPPRIMYKKDGSDSENRLKWLEFLKNQGLPETHNEPVEYISDYEEPNPNGHEQIKNWLFSIGWEPETFNYVREDKGMRKVPQIKDKDENDGSLCSSVLKLVEKEPALENLDSLYIISHRISVLNGFLRDQINGKLYQGIKGLTNTLRARHSVIVNLPNVFKPYSENVRKCLIADDGMVMVGSDLAGIEDSTKRHYIYQFDPEYVKSMMIEGYDSHLELGILGGLITQEEADFYKNFDKSKDDSEKYGKIKEKRHISKQGNFALTYKTGVETLMRTTGLTKKPAENLKKAYWSRNKAILQVEDSLKVRVVDGQKWLLNPVSGFYYSLRSDKDKFSTLNQGTATFVYDLWIENIIKLGFPINFQYHDEFSGNLNKGYEEQVRDKILKAMDIVNETLKLNVIIGCDIKFGSRYTEVH